LVAYTTHFAWSLPTRTLLHNVASGINPNEIVPENPSVSTLNGALSQSCFFAIRNTSATGTVRGSTVTMRQGPHDSDSVQMQPVHMFLSTGFMCSGACDLVQPAMYKELHDWMPGGLAGMPSTFNMDPGTLLLCQGHRPSGRMTVVQSKCTLLTPQKCHAKPTPIPLNRLAADVGALMHGVEKMPKPSLHSAPGHLPAQPATQQLADVADKKSTHETAYEAYKGMQNSGPGTSSGGMTAKAKAKIAVYDNPDGLASSKSPALDILPPGTQQAAAANAALSAAYVWFRAWIFNSAGIAESVIGPSGVAMGRSSNSMRNSRSSDTSTNSMGLDPMDSNRHMTASRRGSRMASPISELSTGLD